MNKRILIILLFTFPLLIYNLGSWGLTETSEARYAEISKEMMESDDYFHPKLLNIYHYHKPPITYYITIAGYSIFGVNEFGARFFLQIALVIQMFLIFKMTLLLFKNENTAVAATLIYFSLPIVLISSRNLTTDVYVSTFILAAIYFWLSYKIKSQRTYALYLFYVFLGLGVATKGPVALLFPLVLIMVYKIVFKQRIISFSWHHFIGLSIFLVISSYWEIIISYENRKVWDYFIENQVLQRITNASFNRTKPLWFYLLFIPLLCTPWSIILINEIRKKRLGSLTKASFEFLLLTTIIILIVVFSIFKTKLILYVLPLMGFVAILTAQYLTQASHYWLRFYNRFIVVLIYLFLAVILTVNLFKIDFHFNFGIACIISALSITGLLLIQKRHFHHEFKKTTYLAYHLSATMLITGSYFLNENQSQINSVKHVIEFIKDLKTDRQIVVYNYLIPSAEFYSHKKIVTLNDGHNTVQRETQFENNNQWEEYLVDLKTEEGKKRAKLLLLKNSALITRKKRDLPKNLNFLLQNLKNRKEFGSWVLYY